MDKDKSQIDKDINQTLLITSNFILTSKLILKIFIFPRSGLKISNVLSRRSHVSEEWNFSKEGTRHAQLI